MKYAFMLCLVGLVVARILERRRATAAYISTSEWRERMRRAGIGGK